ncbi:MAG: hypothetical protein ACPGWR_06515 [Ardenticatenaceae bacterium]
MRVLPKNEQAGMRVLAKNEQAGMRVLPKPPRIIDKMRGLFYLFTSQRISMY